MSGPGIVRFLLVLCVAWAAACAPPAGDGGVEELTILYTANVQGELERCGCAEAQQGGVARRGTVLRRLRGPRTLVVDAGDFLFGSFARRVGPPAYYAARSAAMVRAMNHMAYDAAVPGEYDFAAGPGLVEETAAQAAFPLVLSNLHARGGAEVPWVPYAIVERAGLRVGVVAFLDGRAEPPAFAERLDGLVLEDPRAAARRILPGLARRTDVVVALLHFQVEDAASFLRAFPRIHVAVLGHVKGDGRPRRMGGAVAAACSDLGKAVGRLRLEVAPGRGVLRAEGELVPVPEETPPDPAVEEVVRAFRERGRGSAFVEQVPVSPLPPGQAYAGADACRGCHPVIYDRWRATPHAFALDTLEDKGAAWDPECVVCHAVGLGRSSGFRGRAETPHLAGVQCESCHGPAAAHAAGRASMPHGVSPDRCRGCHTEVHSPGFAVPLYLERADQCTLPGR